MQPGTRIRYTEDNLGLIGHGGTVMSGELGTYLGPGPDEGWHFTEPDEHPKTVCPVGAGMFEEATENA